MPICLYLSLKGKKLTVEYAYDFLKFCMNERQWAVTFPLNRIVKLFKVFHTLTQALRDGGERSFFKEGN